MLAAYKDILSPWKELLTWYSTKEDVRIKYEQIVSQFEPPGLVAAELMEEPPARIEPLAGEIAVAGLTYAEDGGANRVDRVSFTVPAGEHAALVGGGHSGKDDVTHLIARLRLSERRSHRGGGQQFRRGTPGGSGTAHRLRRAERLHLLGTRCRTTCTTASCTSRCGRRPTTRRVAKREETRVRDALIAGNSPDDVRADWIDYEAAGVADADGADRRRARDTAARGDGAGGHRLRPCERLRSAQACHR